ncbi:MAG: hypothetical protein U0233_06015 [Nitrospira sp.]
MGTTPIPPPDATDELHRSLPNLPPTIRPYTLGQRWRSRYHAIWYHLSERMRWSRRPYRETPVGHLSGLAPWQATRIEALRAQYGATFEAWYGRHTALANYAYLDLLDQAWHATDRVIPAGGRATDVGCANFWYAHTLHRFFRPSILTGVDVEGFRLYPTGYSRYDAAAGYVADLPHTSFVVADYSTLEEQVDVITAWFPFVTPAPVLAWRLPSRSSRQKNSFVASRGIWFTTARFSW